MTGRGLSIRATVVGLAGALVLVALAGAGSATALDRAAALVGAREAWGSDPSPGRGVVVGVVDSGVDPRHDDFRAPDGRTRIAGWLDLGAPPRGGEQAALERELGGAVWLATDLDGALQGVEPPPLDEDGHGTAVAAAAAGDGTAGAGTGAFAGVAPFATLVAVRALRRGAARYRADDVLAGVRFVFAMADLERLPAVVVIPSASLRDEPTAGGGTLSEALAALVREAPGRAIVAAAGNLGSADVHRSLELDPRREVWVELVVPAADDVPGGVEVALRWAGGEGAALQVTPPDGAALALGALTPGPAGRRDPERDCAVRDTIDCDPDGRPADVLASSGAGELRLHRASSFEPDGSAWATLQVLGGGARPPLAHGRWRLSCRGDGRLDVVVARAERPGGWRRPYLLDEGPSRGEHALVGWPAAAPEVLAVGATVSRERPPRSLDEAGEPPSGLERAAFSGAGPAFDGRPEPDLVAPGGWLVSALAAGSRYATDPAYAAYRPSTSRVVVTGTSFSAPLAAGALALVLARHPGLDAATLAALARASARAAEQPPPAYDPELGAGLLDVPELLAAADALAVGPPSAADPGRSAASLTRTSLGAGDSLASVVVRPRARDGAPVPAVVSVESSLGEVGPAQEDTSGRVVVPLDLSGVQTPGRARIVVRVDGTPLPVLALEVRRAAVHAGGGGGCQLAPGGSPPAGAGAAELAVLLLTVRRRRWSRARGPRRGRGVVVPGARRASR